MRLLILTIFFASFSACATRTLYQPQDNSGGFVDGTLEKDIKVSRFSGNAYTAKNDAKRFSEFRAIEVCHERGYKVAKLIETYDNSQNKNVQRTSYYQNQNPTYVNATANTINGNTNIYGTVTGGERYGGSRSWNETYTFPVFDTYFTCINENYVLDTNVQNISAEDIKEFTKDKLGGVQVMDIAESSPNISILKVGDIILNIEESRVLNTIELSKAVNEAKNKTAIKAKIVRNGIHKNINLTAYENTESIMKSNAQLINMACTIPEVQTRSICESRNSNK